MSTEALTQEILRGHEAPAKRFDTRSAAPFVNKSVSEQTRRAYSRTVREFFQSAVKHPSEIVPNDVLLWSDRLRAQRKSAATVAFKLSVMRSLLRVPESRRGSSSQLGLDEAGLAA